MARSRSQRGVEPAAQLRAVRQAGQRVVAGLVQQRLLGLGALGGQPVDPEHDQRRHREGAERDEQAVDRQAEDLAPTADDRARHHRGAQEHQAPGAEPVGRHRSGLAQRPPSTGAAPHAPTHR